MSHDELVERLNVWRQQHGIAPASGQASEEISARTLRYYRATGLMDAPSAGRGRGYTERHFLQCAAVRLLQGQGLPLNRIHTLLFGRPDEELRRVVDEGVKSLAELPVSPAMKLPVAETWNVTPLSGEWLLVSRHGGSASPEVLEKIRKLLASSPKASRASHLHS